MNNQPKQPDQAHPQPIAQMKITIMSDGAVNVTGFPTDMYIARHWLSRADVAIVDHFIKLAKAGKLDENNVVIEKKIITQDKSLIGADGRPLQ